MLPFATELFPPEEKQSEQEIKEVANRYAASGHWQQVAAGYAPPWGAGGSKANFLLLANAIKKFRSSGKRLRVDHIAEIVFTLASQGVLERVPQTVVVEKPAPTPTPPSARDLHNQQVKRDRAMNDSSTSPIKGAKSQPQPLVVEHSAVLTEEQRVALNEKKRAEDATIAEAQRRISTYTGASHSRTYSGRSELTAVFTAAMDEGVDANEVLARVDQAIDRLAGNSSIR